MRSNESPSSSLNAIVVQSSPQHVDGLNIL